MEPSSSKFADFVALIVVGTAICVLAASFYWMVSNGNKLALDNMHRAEKRARQTSRDMFGAFAALPPSASEATFRDTIAGRAVQLLNFDSRSGRTKLTIKVHEYADTTGARITHLELCFDYTLLRPEAGTSTYQEVKCPAKDEWTRWDLYYPGG
ncbi:hypothetical protein [Actinomadura meridiana]